MKPVPITDDEWRSRLTPEQFKVLRQKGTELAGTGKLLFNEQAGQYTCAACSALLFSSDSKYESTIPGLIGWPSFSEAADSGAVELSEDTTMSMDRIEVTCKSCGGHLGHLFDDPSSPNGQHFCINSVALNFIKTDKSA